MAIQPQANMNDINDIINAFKDAYLYQKALNTEMRKENAALKARIDAMIKAKEDINAKKEAPPEEANGKSTESAAKKKK